MKIWLDTIDHDVIKEATKLGVISGITTNPKILSESSCIPTTLSTILKLQEGPVAQQVTSDAMIEEGRAIYKFSNRMIVKVPVCKEGLLAMKTLIQEGIPVMATTIVSVEQALLAAQLRADYLAVYFSYLENPIETLTKMQRLNSKILVASLRNVDQIISCLELGVDSITIKKDLFSELVTDHPIAEQCLQKFKACL